MEATKIRGPEAGGIHFGARPKSVSLVTPERETPQERPRQKAGLMRAGDGPRRGLTA